MKLKLKPRETTSHRTWRTRRASLALSLLMVAALPLIASPHVAAFVSSGASRGGQAAAANRRQPQITQAQADLYERWRANINSNQQTAFEAGREYLAKYPNDEYAARVRRWIEEYETAERRVRFESLLFNEKKYAAAFPVGKEILADEPDNVRTIISLAWAGYLASNGSGGEASLRAETLEFARRAITLLEQGSAPKEWKPFTGKADAVAYLDFVIGDLMLSEKPAESINYFRKAIESGGAVKGAPVIYSRLAAAYVAGEYEPLARRFRDDGGAHPPEREEDKAALVKLHLVIDRLIDAYARAVLLSGTEPQYAESRARWMQELTRFYKFRHQDSTAGLEAYIAGATARPLP